MKLKLVFASALIAMASQASAALFLVSNVVTGDASGDGLFQNTAASGSALLDGGIVALGYFAGGAPSSSLDDIAATIAGFTIQATGIAGSFSTDLDGSFPGYVQNQTPTQGTIFPVGAPLLGAGVYIFVGNAATLGTSTAWALAQTTTIAADVPLEQTYIANPLGVTPTIGTIGSSGGFSTLQLVAAAPIPEPSAALLGALGALGLLRRRRN